MSLLRCDFRDPKFKIYYVEGQRLYNQYCSNCHSITGNGLGQLYPPLIKSDYMAANINKVFCLMKYGISDSIKVNGVVYNRTMFGVPSLTELEIAEIATYIYNSWGNEKGYVDVSTVSKAMKDCNAKN